MVVRPPNGCTNTALAGAWLLFQHSMAPNVHRFYELYARPLPLQLRDTSQLCRELWSVYKFPHFKVGWACKNVQMQGRNISILLKQQFGERFRHIHIFRNVIFQWIFCLLLCRFLCICIMLGSIFEILNCGIHPLNLINRLKFGLIYYDPDENIGIFCTGKFMG